jgi:S-adenosylhomocysteine hydrolase
VNRQGALPPGNGRLVNPTAAGGRPASIVDRTSANQTMASEYLLESRVT